MTAVRLSSGIVTPRRFPKAVFDTDPLVEWLDALRKAGVSPVGKQWRAIRTLALEIDRTLGTAWAPFRRITITLFDVQDRDGELVLVIGESHWATRFSVMSKRSSK